MNPAHAILFTYRDVLLGAKAELERQLENLGDKRESTLMLFDSIIKQWAATGKLDTTNLTDQGKILFYLGLSIPGMLNAQQAIEQYHGLLANPPQNLAWVAQQKLQAFKQAVAAGNAIEAAMEKNPEWDPAECFLDECNGGPCQKLCTDCSGHCLGGHEQS